MDETKTYLVTVAVDRQLFPVRVKLVAVSESAAAENEDRAQGCERPSTGKLTLAREIINRMDRPLPPRLDWLPRRGPSLLADRRPLLPVDLAENGKGAILGDPYPLDHSPGIARACRGRDRPPKTIQASGFPTLRNMLYEAPVHASFAGLTLEHERDVYLYYDVRVKTLPIATPRRLTNCPVDSAINKKGMNEVMNVNKKDC